MSEEKRCCAPLTNVERCSKIIREGSLIHCEEHYPLGIRRYKLYKRLCKTALTFDIENVENQATILDKIKYLHRCHHAYFNAYNGRAEHRKLLVPKCWDDGHKHQFNLIINKIEKCETRLEILYTDYLEQKKQLHKDIYEDTTESEVKYCTDNLKVESVIDKVKDFKKRRSDDEREEIIAITKYNKENKKIVSDKLKIIDKIISKLRSFITINSKYEYYQIISIYTIILTMDEVMKSFDTVVKTNGDLVRSFRLSDPSFTKYNNARDYLGDVSENNLLFVLHFIEDNYAIMNDFLDGAKLFWQSNDIDIQDTVAFMLWNPFKKIFKFFYENTDLIRDLTNQKNHRRISRRFPPQ